MTGAAPPGRVIGVVGPSGVGKDSVMAGIAERRGSIACAQRVITRPPAPESEAHMAVDAAGFADLVASGAFALHWQAHGLHYGVPWTALAPARQGRDVLVNLSRGVLDAAQASFGPAFRVLSITAPPDILRARRAARGREAAEAIAGRVARSARAFAPGLRVAEIDNSGTIDDAIAAAIAVIDRDWTQDRSDPNA